MSSTPKPKHTKIEKGSTIVNMRFTQAIVRTLNQITIFYMQTMQEGWMNVIKQSGHGF
jgi:hypothetical protein